MPEFPNMDIIPQTPYERLAPLRNDYNRRLRTFDHRWPTGVPVTPHELASDMFYYTGLEDKVQCTHCGGILSGWSPGDVVTLEHKRHFPNCPWVRQCMDQQHPNYVSVPAPANMTGMSGFNFSHTTPSGQNFNLQYQASLGPNDLPGVTRPKFHQYAMEPARKATFRGWPTQISQKPDELSKAGFFYMGEGDKCKCFYCGGILWDWEPGDDPWVEHAKWFPDCPWMKLAKGDQFIEDIQREMNAMQIDESSSRGPIVQETSVKSVEEPSSVSDSRSTSRLHVPVSPVQESATPSTTSLSDDEKKKLEKLLAENEKLKEEKLCKICLDEEVGVLFEPCGHICCCATCSVNLQQCPICRKDIKKSVKAYIS